MIEIKPMDEGYLHLMCLHDGPVDTTTFEPPPDPLPGGHPPHPWSDRALREVAEAYRLHEVYHPRPAPFMREMIRRYGTCAMLAWEGQQVIGHLRFYPMQVARLFIPQGEDCPSLSWAGEPQDDAGTLWVQCVMASRPYVGPDPDTVTGRNWPAMQEAGARRGVGLRLVQGLIGWAGEHGWNRIAKVAHADLDCFYGQLGGGGKAFWQKAGFGVDESFYERPERSAEFMGLAESEGREKGVAPEEVWTWYRMVYEL